ncbi:DUF4186 family protein [Naumannella halotolerans]|uniref:Uncharacterized protein DUF4186 n=1 Tax=Naumannella halotolerans TaxID=993414 RepID=A0A4R7JCR6_9ACTN|nr:DUF4186 family protein [Naumannella halotolerans]TDT34259.1 uncharacterized protein DUF4186 [Naumannella halotolerans]
MLDRLARHRFRARFHLRPPERRIAQTRGLPVIRMHALDLLTSRLAPARPPNDGRQTPWGGHPVFRAQHATGTCCRGCLERLHGLPRGHRLTAADLRFVTALITAWVARELRAAAAPGPAGPDHLPGL